MSADAWSYRCSSFVRERDTEGPWLCACFRALKERLQNWRPGRHKKTLTDGALHLIWIVGGEGDGDYREGSMFGPVHGYKSYKPIRIHSAAPWRGATVSYLSQPEWNGRWWHRTIDSQHICIFLKDRCSLLIDLHLWNNVKWCTVVKAGPVSQHKTWQWRGCNDWVSVIQIRSLKLQWKMKAGKNPPNDMITPNVRETHHL